MGIACLVYSHVGAQFRVPMDTEGSLRIAVAVHQTERVGSTGKEGF